MLEKARLRGADKKKMDFCTPSSNAGTQRTAAGLRLLCLQYRFLGGSCGSPVAV